MNNTYTTFKCLVDFGSRNSWIEVVAIDIQAAKADIWHAYNLEVLQWGTI